MTAMAVLVGTVFTIVVIAAAALAVSTRDARIAIIGLLVALLAAPFVAEPVPDLRGIGARLAGAVLGTYPLWMIYRGGEETTTGSRGGAVIDGMVAIVAALAAASAAVGWDVAGRLNANGLGELIAQLGRIGTSLEPPFLPAMAPADVGSPDVNVSRPPVHDRPYFLFVGRLERIKGLDDVIPLFTGEGAADLLIVGDGGHRVSLEALAAGSPRVRFLGWKDADALDALYQQAQALIMPSVCYETFGITILEAFRQGTPVIARDIGPFPDIVLRSGGGVLFSSPEALAQALHAMLEHTAMRDRMAAAAREAFAAHWSETVVVPQYVEIARRAAARRHQTPSRATLHG